MLNSRNILVGLMLLAIINFCNAQIYDGYVIKIIDGDTIHLLTEDKKTIKVRLAQIDAPERKQAFGTRSRQALANMVFRKSVRVFVTGYDKYNRAIGTIYLNNTNVNIEMVRQGMAWAYPYFVTDKEIFNIEAEARKEKRGLWIDPSPVPPWIFRK